ncbi:MAG: transporter, partial [Candidatus Binatia bacterium]
MAETTDSRDPEAQKRALYRIGEWLIAYRRPVAGLSIVLTAIMAIPASRLDMHTSFADLLPYRHPYIQVHNKYASQFGGANTVMIMLEVKEGTIFTQEALTKIYKMTQELDKISGVNHDQIDSIGHRTARWIRHDEGGMSAPPIMWRAPRNQQDADEIRNIVHLSEHIYGTMVSLNDKAALIRANFHEGRVDYHGLFKTIDRQVVEPFQDENTVIWVAGEPRLYGWIYEYVGEVKWIFAVTTILMWIMLYFYFHDWRGALRPTITAVISAIWGLGMVHLIGFPMDPLALVIPFFATARALSHSVQMHDRYYEEYHRNHWNKERA